MPLKYLSKNKSIKNLIRLNALIILLVFFAISISMYFKSYQAVEAVDEKELSLLLEQERSILDQRFLSYKMTLESIQSLLNKAIRDKEKIDEEAIQSVTMALISSQPYVFSLFYALEPRYAQSLKKQNYYIYALLKDFSLIGTDAFSEKKNIKMYEYFDGDYYKNAYGSNQRWYHAAKGTKSIFLTEPYYDAPYLKLTMFTAVLALTDKDGNFAGIVGMDIPLAAFCLENAKRSSALHYRSLLVDKDGNSFESLIQETDFKYPAKYTEEDVFKFDAKNTKIPQVGKFKLHDKEGNNYTALSAPIFNDNLKLVVIKSRRAAAALSGFYRDILLALLALLPLQFLLTHRTSEQIYKNIKILFDNFKKNTERVKKSRDVFTPVHIEKPLDYVELEDVKRMWDTFLGDFYKTLQEVKIEKDKSVKALEFQSMFIANMSHEIRTPMNAIVGMVELLMETDLTEKQKNILKIFSSSSDNLLALLNDILDLAKIESGSMKIENIKTNLEKIKDDTLMVYREKALNKNLDFIFTIDSDVNPLIKTDPVRLKQIIFNLVGNAIKFTEKGKVEIRIKNHKNKHRNGLQKIVIMVKDTGIGIPKNKIKYIFQKFTQADISTTRKYGGSGLGLSIVKSLLRLMNGTVNLRTQPGLGSTFIVTLPVEFYEESAQKTSSNSVAEPVAKITQAPKDFKVLIADDVLENRLLLEMYAKIMGLYCEFAENGAQAVEMAQKNSYNLIILDIQMPIMDGAEALKKIRALNNKNSSAPILAFSAYASKTDEEKYLGEGFNEYLTKPLSKKKFIDCLTIYIERQTSKTDL